MEMNLKFIMVTKINKIYAIKSAALLLLPLFLIVFTGELRPSISDYAYSGSGNLFAVLLTISGTLFLNNGLTSDKWYNILLGLSLYGVVLTPHLKYSVLHYTFASLFFLGSITVMIIYSSSYQRPYKIVAGVFILIALAGYYFGWYALFYAEWLGLLPISLHLIGESLNKID